MAKLLGSHLSNSATLTFQTGGLAALLSAAGGSFPFLVTVSFPNVGFEIVSLDSQASTDVANATRGVNITMPLDFPDSADVSLLQVRQVQDGNPIPTPLTGSQNVGSISGTVNVPMSKALYQATIGGNTTLTASNGSKDNIARFVIVTSGTTSRTVTFGTGFRSASLATGTTSGKHFKLEFAWNDIDNVWDEISRTAAQ